MGDEVMVFLRGGGGVGGKTYNHDRTVRVRRRVDHVPCHDDAGRGGRGEQKACDEVEEGDDEGDGWAGAETVGGGGEEEGWRRGRWRRRRLGFWCVLKHEGRMRWVIK